METLPITSYQQQATSRFLRVAIILIGIGMPILLSLPGWIFGKHPIAGAIMHSNMIMMLEISSLMIWLPIFVGSLFIRRPLFVVATACIGFTLPAVGFWVLGFSRDAQTPVGYFFLPAYCLPATVIGSVIVRVIEKIREK